MIRSISIWPGLPSLAIILFNRLIRGILPNGGHWMDGTVKDHGDSDHNNSKTYNIRIMITSRTARHVKATLLSSEQYLRDHFSKQRTHTSAEMTYTDNMIKIHTLLACTHHTMNTHIKIKSKSSITMLQNTNSTR